MINDPYELARFHGADHDTAVQLKVIEDADPTGWRTLWTERLNDPGWCERAKTYRNEYNGEAEGDEFRRYLQPWFVVHIRDDWIRKSNPFDPDIMRIRAFIAACEAGGEFESKRIDTGEITDRYNLPGSPQGAAPSN